MNASANGTMKKALAQLRKDRRLAPVIKRVGPPRFHEYSRGDLLHNILEAILAQQLSSRVARVIFGRFKAQQGKGFPDPRRILKTPDDVLRGLGFSRAKVSAVKNLSQAILSGGLDLDALRDLSDEEVIEALTRVKGIGPWTAHMALIFALRRPDVWPAADLGLRKALQALMDLPDVPTTRDAEPMGDPWRPYRSYACWYLWQVNDA